MDPTKESERRAVSRVAELREARGLGRTVLAKSLNVADNAITERFGGRTRTKLGDLLVMVEAMGGDLEEDLVGIAGGFHPEIYLRDLCARDERQKRYARSDVLLPPPRRPYSALQLARVAPQLHELRVLDGRKAYKRSLRALRTLQYYPDRGDRQTKFEVLHVMAAIWREKGSYSAAAASLSQAFLLAGQDRKLRACAYVGLTALARDVGDFGIGLEAAKRAGRESLEMLDFRGLGRSLINLGQTHFYLGDLDAALLCFQSGLLMVEDDVWSQRYAGWQGLAYCRLLRGELEEALASASDARAELEAAPEKTPLLMSFALLLRGEIRLRLDLAEDGAGDLENVLETFLANGPRPLDVALTAIRLARAYRIIGKANGLKELTRRLRPLAVRGRTSGKLTAAAFAELDRLLEGVTQRDGTDDSSRPDWLAATMALNESPRQVS